MISNNFTYAALISTNFYNIISNQQYSEQDGFTGKSGPANIPQFTVEFKSGVIPIYFVFLRNSIIGNRVNENSKANATTNQNVDLMATAKRLNNYS